MDLVAHTRLKTPTAVAAFLIHCLDQQAATLNDLEERFTQEVRGWLKEESYTLQQIGSRFPMLVKNRLEKNLSATYPDSPITRYHPAIRQSGRIELGTNETTHTGSNRQSLYA